MEGAQDPQALCRAHTRLHPICSTNQCVQINFPGLYYKVNPLLHILSMLKGNLVTQGTNHIIRMCSKWGAAPRRQPRSSHFKLQPTRDTQTTCSLLNKTEVQSQPPKPVAFGNSNAWGPGASSRDKRTPLAQPKARSGRKEKSRRDLVQPQQERVRQGTDYQGKKENQKEKLSRPSWRRGETRSWTLGTGKP